MAKRLFSVLNLSWTAQAAGALTASTYATLQTNSATAVADVLEVMISGLASASTLGGFQLVRASTLATGAATALAAPNSDGPMHPATAALTTPVIAAIVFATTQMTASAATTDARLNLGMNTFGGIIRWNAAPTQQFTLMGNTAPGAAGVLYNSTASGGATSLANAHIMYEPY